MPADQAFGDGRSRSTRPGLRLLASAALALVPSMLITACSGDDSAEPTPTTILWPDDDMHDCRLELDSVEVAVITFERRSNDASPESLDDLLGSRGNLAAKPVHWSFEDGAPVGAGRNLDGTCGGSITAP